VLEVGWTARGESILDTLQHIHFHVLLVCQRSVELLSRAEQVPVHILWCLLEVLFKPLASPLQCMFDLIWEVLQSADRNTLFWRIASRTVVLGQLWHDNLSVALGAKCARFQEGQMVEQASLIDVQTSFHVVQ